MSRPSAKIIVTTFALMCLLAIVVVAGTIDLVSLFNYENQPIPNYINRDNTGGNAISDEAATLGRVLFYDKKLSVNDTVSCASCHQQQFAFSDTAVVSQGVNGVTGRHSMRLVNARFGDEVRFFWDERAATLEAQVTQPIQDHTEMGFSGTNGDPTFDDLIAKMEATPYYKSLFTLAFGDAEITEARMQIALAQFIRSIQSFDTKFDSGLAQVNGNLNANFPNFTAQENAGKQLFLGRPQFENPGPGQPATGRRVGGGLGCQACHIAPEFSIDRQGNGVQRNNGVITVANAPGEIDLTNTRTPSLREMFSVEGDLNGPLMHDGSFATMEAVLAHYNDIDFDPDINPNLDPRLTGSPRAGVPGPGQKLLMTAQERDAVVAFLKTLSGTNVYTDERWSDPFDPDGTLDLDGNVTIDAIEISDNSDQRCAVESLTLKFAGNVELRDGAISVIQRSTADQPTFESVGSTFTRELVGDQTIVVVTFDDHVRNGSGVLEDGNYQITLAGHLILRDGIPLGTDVVFGDQEAHEFFCYYGDSDGDRDVDNVDLAIFLQTYRKGMGDDGFNINMDYDADGDVDNVDLANFLQRYRGTIPFDFGGDGPDPPAITGGGGGSAGSPSGPGEPMF